MKKKYIISIMILFTLILFISCELTVKNVRLNVTDLSGKSSKIKGLVTKEYHFDLPKFHIYDIRDTLNDDQMILIFSTQSYSKGEELSMLGMFYKIKKSDIEANKDTVQKKITDYITEKAVVSQFDTVLWAKQFINLLTILFEKTEYIIIGFEQIDYKYKTN